MLQSIQKVLGCRLEAQDGPVGSASDVLFDDHAWTIRYFVANTGKWLLGRRVLISPQAVRKSDWGRRVLAVSLTRQQIEDSPPLESQQPVSRGHEIDLATYYAWPMYWMTGSVLPLGTVPMADQPPLLPSVEEGAEQGASPQADPNLQSAKEVIGYSIHAHDGLIGKVANFIADSNGWAIRYMIVDTHKWLPGRKVLISPAWVEKVSWPRREVFVSVSRQAIQDSPPYDETEPINRRYEMELHEHYGVPAYWLDPTAEDEMTAAGAGPDRKR